MIRRNNRLRRRGYTIIELVVVMAIMVIMAGALVPSLGGLGRSGRLRAGTRGLLGQVRLARELAVSNNTWARVQLDPVEGSSTLQELGADDAQSELEWRDVRRTGAGPLRLPDGVSFARSLAADSAQADELLFAPNGSAEDWFVILEDGAGARLAVQVRGVLGTSRVLAPGEAESFDELARVAEETP